MFGVMGEAVQLLLTKLVPLRLRRDGREHLIADPPMTRAEAIAWLWEGRVSPPADRFYPDPAQPPVEGPQKRFRFAINASEFSDLREDFRKRYFRNGAPMALLGSELDADAMRYVSLGHGMLSNFSSCVPLLHGDRTFEEFYRALQDAQDEIFIATWAMEPNMELVRTAWDQPITARAPYVLENILIDRAKAGVVIRCLVWNFLNLTSRDPLATAYVAGRLIMAKVRNLGEKLAKIDQRNEVVVVDHWMPFASTSLGGVPFYLGGSHHQKFWITRSGSNLTAFIGGINLRQWDWDTADHLVLDQRRNPADMEGAARKRKESLQQDPDYAPRHDVMVKLEGPAAYCALEEFNRRWAMAGKGKLALMPRDQVPRSGKLFVQTSHTYPVAFGGGSFEILRVYERAISQARRYVYFENQYWTSADLTDALIAQLKKEQDLEVVIVLPNKAEDLFIGPFLGWEQWYQLSRLWGAASLSRVRVYTLYRKHPIKSEYVNIYVHSKTAIIDDLWATIGSANTNNRSMLVDTEFNVQIANGAAVKTLRKLLWREMVGDTRGESDDPIMAIRNGFHPAGETNERLMKEGKELKGFLVPLKKPEETARAHETLRLLF